MYAAVAMTVSSRASWVSTVGVSLKCSEFDGYSLLDYHCMPTWLLAYLHTDLFEGSATLTSQTLIE